MNGWLAAALGAAGAVAVEQGRKRLRRREQPLTVAAALNAFFGRDVIDLPIVARAFTQSALVDLNLGIRALAEEAGMDVEELGYQAEHFQNDLRSVISGHYHDHCYVAPLCYTQLERGPGELANCLVDGLLLLSAGQRRIVIQIRSDPMTRGQSLEVAVMAHTAAEAGGFLERLADRSQRASIYRGRVVSLECAHPAYGAGESSIRFHRLPAVEREQVILPESVMGLLERNTVGYFEHSEALRKSGRAVRHGVLLHGPPGTGKTYTAMWLAARLQGVTVILLAAEQLGLIKQCCEMARMLQPSMVIMEDIDLVAISRDQEAPPWARVTLHQLLNEMDGLGAEAEVLLLLTTNRPDSIEPALASRPGRIDQAIEYPLPDDDCRRRLFELYARGLTLDVADVGLWVRRTQGASPAFIKELLRKSALVAAMRGGDGSDLHVTDADLDQAIGEMVLGGGALTQRLLAFDEDTQSA